MTTSTANDTAVAFAAGFRAGYETMQRAAVQICEILADEKQYRGFSNTTPSDAATNCATLIRDYMRGPFGETPVIDVRERGAA